MSLSSFQTTPCLPNYKLLIIFFSLSTKKSKQIFAFLMSAQNNRLCHDISTHICHVVCTHSNPHYLVLVLTSSLSLALYFSLSNLPPSVIYMYIYTHTRDCICKFRFLVWKNECGTCSSQHALLSVRVLLKGRRIKNVMNYASQINRILKNRAFDYALP